jgi:O-antigen ligase
MWSKFSLKNKSYFLDQTLQYISCLFVFGINLPDIFIPKFIVALLGVLIFSAITRISDSNGFFIKEKIAAYISILFYLWLIITLLYTSDKQTGFKLLETRLFFLAFPILIILNKKIEINKEQLLVFYLSGILFSIIYCYIVLYINGFKSINITNSKNFIFFIINNYKHYNYLGLSFSIGLLSLFQITRKHGFWLQLFCLTMFSIVVIYLPIISGAVLTIGIITIIYITLVSILIFQNNKNLFIIIVLFFIAASIYYVPVVKLKFDFNTTILEKIDNERFLIWKNAVELIKEKPILGLGVGDSTQKIKNVLIDKPNAHNQFLDILVESGFIGLILFLGMFIVIFYFFKSRDEIIFSIIVSFIFFIAFLFESYLNRIAGIAQFGFIFFYLLVERKNTKIRFNIKPLIYVIGIIFSMTLLSVFYNVRNKNFDPLFPRTYMTGPIYEIPYQDLPKFVPDEVPNNAKGVLIDNQAFFESWNGNLYYWTKNHINNNIDEVETSVYCYVSDDFNGSWVAIRGECNRKIISSGYYDITYKGNWQKLKASFLCENKDKAFTLYIAKDSSLTVDELEGFILFVYPSIVSKQKVVINE